MSLNTADVGLSVRLHQKTLRASAVAALMVTCVLGSSLAWNTGLQASGETRSISLYHIHTKESLSITYMENGRYVPSAMKKINYLMRDWRKDQTVNIDPHTLDLLWELHEDLNSQSPIHIVCGYRSKRTNAFLKRIGRNVAMHSQHSEGKAIDFYFPDVPTKKIRNLALYRQIGGVGYYRSAGGPTGFLHIDSAHVRHWGPRISNSEMASIMRDGRKIAGRYLTGGNDDIQVAEAPKSAGRSLFAFLTGRKKPAAEQQVAPVQVAAQQPMEQPVQQASYTDLSYDGDRDNFAQLANDASTPPTPRPAPRRGQDNLNGAALASLSEAAVSDETAGIRQGYPIPIPRQKPIEILAMAAANIRIIPTSAEPEDQAAPETHQLAMKLLDNRPSLHAAHLEEETEASGKTDLGGGVLTASLQERPAAAPHQLRLASALSSDDLALWKSLVTMNAATLKQATPPAPALENSAAEETQTVNREGKGPMPRLAFRLSDLLSPQADN